MLTERALDYPDAVFDFFLSHGIHRLGFNVEEIEGIHYSILRALEGYVIGDPEFTKMFEGWFRPNGVTPYSKELLEAHFQGVINSRARIPRTEY